MEPLKSLNESATDQQLHQSQASLHGQVFPRFGAASKVRDTETHRGTASPRNEKAQAPFSGLPAPKQSQTSEKGSQSAFTDDSANIRPSELARPGSRQRTVGISSEAGPRRPNVELNRYFEEASRRRAFAASRRADGSLKHLHSALLPVDLQSNRATGAQDDSPSYRSGSFSGHRKGHPKRLVQSQ